MDDLPFMFVSRYQLPLFVPGSDEPIIFSDNFSITSENHYQSIQAPIYEENNYNKLDDRLFELDSFIEKTLVDKKYIGLVNVNQKETVRKTGSKATKKANQRRTRKRRLKKEVKKTNTKMEELPDNEIINYFSNLMAQVDFTLQAELEKLEMMTMGSILEK